MHIPHSKGAGLLLGAGGVVILSPDALMLKLFGGGNFALASGRGFALALCAAAAALALPALRRGFRWRTGILYGAFYAAGLASFPLSVRHTHAANTVVILAVAPFLSALGAKWFLRENISKKTWFACVFAAAGLALVFAPQIGKGGGLGDALALLTALSLAGCALLIRANPHTNLFCGLILGGLFAALAYAPFADWNLAAKDAALVAANGALVFAAFVCIMAASRRLPPPEVNLLFLLETALAPLWVWLALGEKPPATTVAAGILIAAVLAWHSAGEWRRK